MFNNVYDVKKHIDNKIDYSIHPEEKHNILLGNIAIHLAGNSRNYSTYAITPSILGAPGDVIIPEQLITSQDGKATSLSGRPMNVPLHILDDNSPIFFGESGFGADWKVLNNSQNNIGYALDFEGNRSLGFPYHATSGTDIKAIPHSPSIELVESNGKKIPSWTPFSKVHPTLFAPVNDWTKQSN